MKVGKFAELDNGFIITLMEDDSLRTFNECNVYKYVPTIEDVLAEIKKWSENVDKMKKGDENEKEKKD